MKTFGAALNAVTWLVALCAWLSLGTAAAGAAGTMMIVHQSGTTNTYDDVEIKIIRKALYLTSEDGKGTLVVDRAACSFQGKLLVCFATDATLIQQGDTSPLDFKTGTIYLNDTDDALPLVLSTAKVPAHSVVLSLTTKRGTYISLNGRIDKVIK